MMTEILCVLSNFEPISDDEVDTLKDLIRAKLLKEHRNEKFDEGEFESEFKRALGIIIFRSR